MSMKYPNNSITRSTEPLYELRCPPHPNWWWSGFYRPPACAYDRKQALSGDLQKEVSPEYREHLYREWSIDIPLRVFLTKPVIEACKIPHYYEEKGRLHKTLVALIYALRYSNPRLTRIPFTVWLPFEEDDCRNCICLHAVWSTADIDDPSPSTTIVMPDEG